MQQHCRTDSGDILVVDDDPIIVEMLTELLVFEGYDVRSAQCGPEALDAILARRPALILLDLQIPSMPGVTETQTMPERDDLSESCRQLIMQSDGLVAQSRLLRAQCAALTAQLHAQAHAAMEHAKHAYSLVRHSWLE
jgi:CheY-like chemotaxis protein